MWSSNLAFGFIDEMGVLFLTPDEVVAAPVGVVHTRQPPKRCLVHRGGLLPCRVQPDGIFRFTRVVHEDVNILLRKLGADSKLVQDSDELWVRLSVDRFQMDMMKIAFAPGLAAESPFVLVVVLSMLRTYVDHPVRRVPVDEL